MRKSIVIIGVQLLITILFFAENLSANFNSFQYFFGDRAGGMGGAYTALANDVSSLWYNPAGLALIKNNGFNLSGSSLNLLVGDRENAVNVDFIDGTKESIDMDESSFLAIPTTFAFGKSLSGIFGTRSAFAVGLFIPFADFTQTSLDDSVQSGSQRFDIYSLFRRSSKLYVFSGGIGISFFKYLNFGVSVGVGYYSRKSTQEFRQYSIDTATSSEVLSNSYVNEDSKSLNLTGNAGLQAKVKHHHLGIFVRLPHYNIYNDSKVETLEDLYTTASGIEIHSHAEETIKPYESIPYHVSGGYAYEIPRSFAVSLEVSYFFKHNDLDKDVTNFSAGVEIYLSGSFILRSGLYTDFSQHDDLDTESREADRADYYGGTLSLTMLNKTEKKKYFTTFGVNYRVGVGEYRTVTFGDQITTSTEDRITHGVQVFFSQSVNF